MSQNQNVFDNEITIIDEGSHGLNVEPGTYQAIVWGLISFQQRDFSDKTQIVDGVAIVVQLPTETDEKGKPKVAWVLRSNFLTDKSKFALDLKGIYGETIGTNHPIRVTNSEGKSGIDPKKITGKNCMVAIANTSKTEGKEQMGITSFSKLMKNLPEYQIDNSVEIPKFLIELKNGKLLNEKGATGTAQEAPTIPTVAGNTAPVQNNTPPVPAAPVQQQQEIKQAETIQNTTPATTGRRGRPAKNTETAATTTQTTQAAEPQKVAFKAAWRIINGVQQTCSICKENQFTRDPAKGGGWTCKNQHRDAESTESLLNPPEDDAPDMMDDESPDAIGA